MEDIYRWDREEKLFAVEGLKQLPPERRARPLQQLVVDEDPVVRGKAALALKDCEDDVLVEAAEVLFEQARSETTILGLEILGAVEERDFTELLRSQVETEDPRVIKSVIQVLDGLPAEAGLRILNELMERYESDWAQALKRLVVRWNHPDLLPVLREWFTKAERKQKPAILRLAAGLPSQEAHSWVLDRIETTELAERQRECIRWMLETS